MLALMEEERDTCPSCGHPMAECRDPKTMRTWQVVTEICQPSVVAQVTAEEFRETRGLQIYTRRTEGSGG